jgi:tetratricopeptide (TPR) repeat protein
MAYFWRGRLYDCMKRYFDAINDFSNAIKIEPLNSGNYYGRGLVNVKMNILDNALKDFMKAAELDPTNPIYPEKINEIKKINSKTI